MCFLRPQIAHTVFPSTTNKEDSIVLLPRKTRTDLCAAPPHDAHACCHAHHSSCPPGPAAVRAVALRAGALRVAVIRPTWTWQSNPSTVRGALPSAVLAAARARTLAVAILGRMVLPIPAASVRESPTFGFSFPSSPSLASPLPRISFVTSDH